MPKSHRKRNLAIAAALSILLLSGLVYEAPTIEDALSIGPVPVWHSFPGVFDGSHTLASEDCELQHTLPGIQGIPTDNIGPQTTVTCAFHSTSYIGYVMKDCDLQPTGPIPSVNATLVPYLGCELSYAPLQSVFSGLFVANANGSIPVYENSKVVANISLASTMGPQGCSYHPASVARVNGVFVCNYMGIAYVATNIIQDCNVGTPIQVNGVPIPTGGCMADRGE